MKRVLHTGVDNRGVRWGFWHWHDDEGHRIEGTFRLATDVELAIADFGERSEVIRRNA